MSKEFAYMVGLAIGLILWSAVIILGIYVAWNHGVVNIANWANPASFWDAFFVFILMWIFSNILKQ